MRTVGHKNAWFSFKGRKNTDADLDVQMISMPTRPHPARKGDLIDVPGRDGKLFVDEGAYDRIVVSLRCVARDNANIDVVNAWLTGEGDLIFGDEPDRAYHARITKEFSRSNKQPRLRGQEFSISFDCEPYRYKADPSADVLAFTNSASSTPYTFESPGTVDALPLIKVEGSGEGTLMVNDVTLIFDSITAPVYVDSDAKIAFTGEGTAESPYVLATMNVQSVTGEWPRLKPGYNTLTLMDGIAAVSITPRWRWL